MRENGQTSQHRAGSFIYLLLDIPVGNWNRTWGSVDEVLVGGDLIGLHRSCCTVQLLNDQRKQETAVNITFNHL